MDVATETTADAPPEQNQLQRLREAFNRLGNQQKIMLMVALAAIVTLIVGTILWSRQPEWKVLFSNLGEKDGGAIIAILEQQNIPHRYADNGSLMIHASRVHEVRLKLASQGLPRGGLVWFELMENQKFGTSQFAEQVNYQRGLEGELARTIQSIAAIESARVHLAMPKPSVFVREDQKPTASIMLNLHPGRSLDQTQIAGIKHLVASSVPQLTVANVTIIDQNGSLNQQVKSKLMEAGLDPVQIQYVREIEDGIVKRIEEILKPVFGSDNFKVQVAADLDFSQNEQTAETYRPNSAPEASSIRSQQNNETAGVNSFTGGVPGALTNQPPVPATAPITQPQVGGAPAPAAGRPGDPQGRIEVAGINAPVNALGQPLNASKTATINYEVDKTIRHTKHAIGSIRRLTTAVVVNHRKDVDKAGKPLTRALNEAEIKQVSDLVREAMGYSRERGDSLSVVSAPFTESEKTDVSPPLWKDPENIAYLREILKYLILAGIIFALYAKVIKPSLDTMFPPPPEPEDEASPEEIAARMPGIDGVEGEEDEDGTEVRIDHYAVKVQKARDFAHADPKAVANIIKDWMGVNGG